MSTTFHHIPVLADAVLSSLGPALNAEQPLLVDCTVGGGGHSSLILEHCPSARIIGIDQDPAALQACSDRLGERFTPLRGNFAQLHRLLKQANVAPSSVNGFLYDLGVSSHQLDTPERGFSFLSDGPLDMRMDPSAPLSAADVVNTYSEEELARIIHAYGEERHSRRVARVIAACRREKPFTTTKELADLIHRDIAKFYRNESIHPATRTFQALRIEVNGELDAITTSLESALTYLRPGGILAVISFHSLEDRIIKQFFRQHASTCICPPEVWQCRCQHQPLLEILTRKPLIADEAEKQLNPRSRSAKLRVARRTSA